ncbi:calpain-1 catalytic subunit-like [Discoglossus pictus]
MMPFGGIVSKLMTDRLKASGAGSHDHPYKYMNQDYESLKRQCLERGTLFQDPYFPAITSSLGYNDLGPGSSNIEGVVWKRPKEIVEDPQFIVEGATRTDIRQGRLGNCWVLCAITSLTMNEHLLHRVVPHGQSFQDDYAGIFHFQIWQYGEWMDVVIDDRLPVRKSKLMFVRSAEGSEFWSPLLEKAYAKLNSSYEAIRAGNIIEALENFTGGVGEIYNLDNLPSGMHIIVKKALEKRSMMGCFIETRSEFAIEAEAKNLVLLHAYSVTGLKQVNYKGSKVDLIRLRNPWGKTEWSGAWSDNSPEWNELDPSERNKLQLKMEDGEFWMPFSEFLKLFSVLEICNLTPDDLYEADVRTWHTAMYEGSWRRGSTAGGCKDNPDTFWMNPQYKITLLEEDGAQMLSTVLVAIMQKNIRRGYQFGEKMHEIGFAIYEIPEEFKGLQNTHMKKDFFQTNESCTENYRKLHEVTERICLPHGEYIIVPSTRSPDLNADFVLRIFTEKQSDLIELDEEVSADLPDEVGEDHVTLTEEDVEDSFKKTFQELSGEDMEISVFELKTVLDKEITKNKELKMDGFSMESCRQMVNLMDNDGSGMLGIVEYHILWNKIQKWLTVFRQYDLDNSGTMNSYELRLALETAGFKLNNQLIQVLVTRYSDNDLGINFDNFVCCLVKLEAMFRFFKAMDQKGTDTVTMNMKEWLTLTMCG